MNLYLITSEHLGESSWSLARADSHNTAAALVKGQSDAVCSSYVLEAEGLSHISNYEHMARLNPGLFTGFFNQAKEKTWHILNVDILIDADDPRKAREMLTEVMRPDEVSDYRILSTVRKAAPEGTLFSELLK